MLEVLSLYCEVVGDDGRLIRIVYKLLEEDGGEGALYGVRCYLAGSDRPPCVVRQATADRARAESALTRMAAGGVMPVHIDEVFFELLS